jgi:hypothetical protein
MAFFRITDEKKKNLVCTTVAAVTCFWIPIEIGLSVITLQNINDVILFLCLSAADWVPDPHSFEPDSEAAQLSSNLKKLLLEAQPALDSLQPFDHGAGHDLQVSHALQAMGVKIGDRVVVGGAKVIINLKRQLDLICYC